MGRTKKVGITGKYGTRYGASLRKMVKNGNHPARQVYMQLLWQGLNEADVCWYLELQAMWKDCCWRCLSVLYNSCSHCPLCGTSFEGNERAVKCLYNTLAMVSK